MEKAHPAPRTVPPDSPALASFCRGSRSPLQLKQDSLSLLSPWVRARPPPGFLRARCSWSPLDKGNGKVTATVNCCSRQHDAQSKQKVPRLFRSWGVGGVAAATKRAPPRKPKRAALTPSRRPTPERKPEQPSRSGFVLFFSFFLFLLNLETLISFVLIKAT